jgi:hypothetical protein
MSDPSELQRRLAEAVARDDTVEPLLDAFPDEPLLEAVPDEPVIDLVADEPVIDLRTRTAPGHPHAAEPDLLGLVLNRARYQRVGVAAVGTGPDAADAAPLAEVARLKARHHRRDGEPTVLDLLRLVPPRPEA